MRLRAHAIMNLEFLTLCAALLPGSAGTVMAQRCGPVQIVRGEVVDRDSQLPLPGANVAVTSVHPPLGTVADNGGRFALHDVPVGRHTLRFSFVGYEPVSLPGLAVGAGKEVVLRVELRERVYEGEEVVVTPSGGEGHPLNDMVMVSARAFSVEETRRYAGAVDDPARMASAFAGIVSTGGVQENALVVRGNAPKGVQWRLEGVEIPNPNHFGGLTVSGGGGLTLFSAQLLSDSDVLLGAFPAEYGNALSGVFDMRFRSGNPARREYAVQVGLLGLEGAAEGPFRSGGRATYLINYRYSTLGLLQPLLPTGARTSYQDLSYKVTLPTQRLGRFEMWGIGGLDRQDMPPEWDPSQWEYEFWDRTDYRLRMGTGAAGISHRLVVGPSAYVNSTVALTGERVRWHEDRLSDSLSLDPDFRLTNRRARLTLALFVNRKFTAAHVNRTGGSLQRLSYELRLRSTDRPSQALRIISKGAGSAMLAEAYTQSRFRLGPWMTLTAGAHATYFGLSGALLIEPRAGLRWQMTERQAISTGFGMHSQIEDLRIYLIHRMGAREDEMPNRSLGLARARHLVVGYERRMGEEALLALEVYHQHLFDVAVGRDSLVSLLNFDQDWLFDAALASEGEGRNLGVELTLERFLRDGYYFLLTGSLFRSAYRDADGFWRSSRFDQRYATNALGGREFHFNDGRKVLGLNVRIAAVGGKLRNPVDEAISRQMERVIFRADAPFTVREPGLLVVDLTATYRVNHRKHAQTWALQVKNVLAARDRSLDYNFKTRRVEQVEEGYPLPVLSYKIDF